MVYCMRMRNGKRHLHVHVCVCVVLLLFFLFFFYFKFKVSEVLSISCASNFMLAAPKVALQQPRAGDK